ncbi:hypothetical protein HAX54_038634, partial [Datura stramonium]|nr:hypothetical protein [Datura stramonium]
MCHLVPTLRADDVPLDPHKEVCDPPPDPCKKGHDVKEAAAENSESPDSRRSSRKDEGSHTMEKEVVEEKENAR